MRHEEAFGEGRAGDVVEEAGGFEGSNPIVHIDYRHVHHALGEELIQTKVEAIKQV